MCVRRSKPLRGNERNYMSLCSVNKFAMVPIDTHTFNTFTLHVYLYDERHPLYIFIGYTFVFVSTASLVKSG